MSSETLIVGGGLIGLLTAQHLAEGGVSVRVLERGDTGRESSWAGGGILSPLYPWRYSTEINQLSQWSQSLYPQFLAELRDLTGVDPEYSPHGLLLLDPEEQAAATEWAEKYAVEMRVLSPEEIREQEPGLAEVPEAALLFPRIAHVRNPCLLKAVRARLDQLNVPIETGVEVREILINNGQATGVRTASGDYHAERVVVCSGAWSAQLVENAGVALPVRPVKGQMLLFRAEPGVVRHITMRQGRYLISRQDGRVLMGSTLEEAGFDKQPTEEAKQELMDIACTLFPALRNYPLEKHWAGLRPGAPDGIPFIGPVKSVPGLYINCGHYRNGVVLSLGSARIIADMLLGCTPPTFSHAFSVEK